MIRRLPYRIQIPLGLSLAVLITALLVTAVSARMTAANSRNETLATLNRALVLLVAQTRPLLAADDIWRVFAILRDTVALIPGSSAKQARVAVLDSTGHIFASSDPEQLQTGNLLLGTEWHGQLLPKTDKSLKLENLDQQNGSVILLSPVLSEDGQLQGYVFIEVDADAFKPEWLELAKTALIGVLLAVLLLVPIGWWAGQRMTRPIGKLAKIIERIGSEPLNQLREEFPKTSDPELNRIADAVAGLMAALEEQEKAEERALSSERLAAVGRMTAAVAHEINNPLAGLLTATQTLRLHGDSEIVRERTVNVLDRGLQQIQTTLSALLPQVRIEDRPLEPGDLDDIITLVNATVKRYKANLETEIEIESAIRVASAPLRQVMLNLLINAIKAAGQNGQIFSCLIADKDKVIFSVSNTGTSLNAEKFKSILDAESGANPHGFGLWVCQELANHYGGGFYLDDIADNKTRLVFWVPNRESKGKNL